MAIPYCSTYLQTIMALFSQSDYVWVTNIRDEGFLQCDQMQELKVTQMVVQSNQTIFFLKSDLVKSRPKS